MSKVIKVGMADLNICKAPDVITTLGLGSCIGLVFYDPVTKVGGMVHYMLPDSTKVRNNSNIAKLQIRESMSCSGVWWRPARISGGW